MQQYLESTTYIDWNTDEIRRLADDLAVNSPSKEKTAKNCFEWVRDNIRHSADYKMNPVTCKASDVLRHKTGYCYAKSHLLAALLRANNIPAGLCYQRLSIDDKGAPYCLHGLNAVYLENHGWYRIDARGNKEGINAQFQPPQEQLAFPVNLANEADLPEIWTAPLPVVVSVLETSKTYSEVYDRLPDIELIPGSYKGTRY
ncbi:MAG: transglutaminase family protein [Gammaproteobacteria bacterium]|nr:transglutaminase family protein [Gammaproteobacteria bacterium]